MAQLKQIILISLLLSLFFIKVNFAQSENYQITIENLDAQRLQNEGAIVLGENIGLSERIVFDSLKISNSWMQNVSTLNDTNETLDKFSNGEIKFLMILG